MLGCLGLCEVSHGEPAEVAEFFPRCESTVWGALASLSLEFCSQENYSKGSVEDLYTELNLQM